MIQFEKNVYVLSLTPIGVVTRKEVYKPNIHMDMSYPFEVPDQEMTFGLPVGVTRVVVEKFDVMDLLGQNVQSFDIHDIEKARELYSRLSALGTNENEFEEWSKTSKEVEGLSEVSDSGSFVKKPEKPDFDDCDWVNCNIQGGRV